MKVWQKIYLAVLAVSILFVNIGIYAVFELVYHKNIETEQVRCEVDYTVICESIQSNMKAMHEQGRLSDDAAADLIGIYERKHSKQNMNIKLWRDEKQIYPDNGEKIPFAVGKDEVRIVISGSRKQKEIAVISELQEFGGTYQLYIEYPLSELNAAWDGLFGIYIFISFAISLVLAFILNIMLRFLLRPVRELAAGVSNIGNGDYSSRIPVKGSDEFSTLGENINLMAETIERNISKLKEDNEKKEQLVDNLAHEMKSPLTSIYGFAEYIMNGKIEPEEAAECCVFIMEESMRMKDMCYTLLDLSEIRHRKIEFKHFDMAAFFERMKHVIDMRQSDVLLSGGEVSTQQVCAADSANIDGLDASDGRSMPVTVEWENELPDGKEIYGNERLIEMLILNLVTNAVRACEQKHDMYKEESKFILTNKTDTTALTEETGKIEFKVTVSIKDAEGNKVLLCVKDNGIGIPKEKLSHVTEPFYRVDKGRSRENGGNGLGLSLCRQIVLLHGGKFEINSEEGIGTEILSIFTF